MANGDGEPVARGVATAGPIWERAPRPYWVKAVNGLGAGLRRCGKRWPRLDSEGMIAEARKKTGLADFGDDRFRAGLQALVDAFESRDTANAFGRLMFRMYCVDLLTNRLKVEDDFKRHPEILAVPLERPLFITGLPRSGTTLLHRLMSEDPAGRTMLYWESLIPSPSPRPGTYRTDPRIAQVRKRLKVIHSLAPRLATAHELDAETAEEDNNLFALNFVAGINGFAFDVPDYVRWLREQDLVPSYRYVKRLLQLLSWKLRGDYWVLKAPAHLYGLDKLLTVFPDACIVMTHRDPLQVLPSLCSLAAAFRGIATDRLDLRQIGEEFTEAMPIGLERAMAARALADPARFFDVPYARLTSDPIGTVRAVCQHFGYEFSPEYESRARRYLASNPQHKHGVHRYALSDFGLDAATVDRQFAGYRAWVAEHLSQPV